MNSTHRVEGISTQFSLSGALHASKAANKALFPKNTVGSAAGTVA